MTLKGKGGKGNGKYGKGADGRKQISCFVCVTNGSHGHRLLAPRHKQRWQLEP